MNLSKVLRLSVLTVGFGICSLAYATRLQMVYFPPVPENWTMKVEGTTVEYYSPVNSKTSRNPRTVLRLQYTKKHADKDAKTLAEEYSKEHECKPPKQQGKGFYTISCPLIQRDAVVVGEPGNMYHIELSGDRVQEAMDLINSYVTAIVNGKRTFEDREIGEKVQ